MANQVTFSRTAEHVRDYDVIVAGGGVAGVAAAVSAKRMGKSVLLIEKTIGLGGIATTGLVNLFVSMCNGRGVQIIKGMCEELLRVAIQYSYDTVDPAWQNGEPGQGNTTARYKSRFSAPIFTLELTEFVTKAGVDVLFDTIVTEPVMEGNICRGLVVENKSGCQYYGAKLVVDTTGDADILYRAGVPTVDGRNFHTFAASGVTMENCRKVLEKEDMRYLEDDFMGGKATLYGKNHPEGKPTRKGTTVQDVTEYVIENHLECLENIKADDRKKRTLVTLPYMCQFRETRRIAGDYAIREEDLYRHFDDSIGAINDFSRRDFLFEIPYRTLFCSEYPNLITAGRCAAGEGFMWDVIRVIPPAIITGQAAGVACAMALDCGGDLTKVSVPELQRILASQNVMIHFDDALVPRTEASDLAADDPTHL